MSKLRGSVMVAVFPHLSVAARWKRLKPASRERVIVMTPDRILNEVRRPGYSLSPYAAIYLHPMCKGLDDELSYWSPVVLPLDRWVDE